MTDNAKIVREALGIGGHNYDPRVEAARRALTALESELATAKAREAGLTKALAEVQADLARAREAQEEAICLLRIYHHAWNSDNRVPSFAYEQACTLLGKHPINRAALAPE